MKKFSKFKKKAFTLVEMLVVVAVIGLLFTLNTPDVSNMFNAAKEDLIETDYRTFELGISQAMLDSEGFSLLTDTSSSAIAAHINQYLTGNTRLLTTDTPYKYVSAYKTPYGYDYVLEYNNGIKEFELTAYKSKTKMSSKRMTITWDSTNMEVKSELYE